MGLTSGPRTAHRGERQAGRSEPKAHGPQSRRAASTSSTPPAATTGRPGPTEYTYPSNGNLFITGVVHFGEDGLHSVYLATEQNHPYANTTASPVVAMNFDLETDEQFSLSAVLKPDSDWEANGLEPHIIAAAQERAVHDR